MTEHFRITYDGTALASSEMDVNDLAPALLAIGNLLTAATEALSSDKMKAQVNVRGTFKTGCFGIDFSLATDWVAKIQDLLSGNGATAIANAMAILAALGWGADKTKPGLFAVLKWLKGRKILNVVQHETCAVLHVDNDSIEIEIAVLTLLRDIQVRECCEKVLQPLKTPGITVFSVGDDSVFFETITSNDVDSFKKPESEDELLIDDIRKMAFSIVSLAFKEDNKWRLHDGASTIHAAIEDTDFLHRVDTNTAQFSKGDVLVCDVRVQQWQTQSGAKTEYTVIKVVDHRHAGRQVRLPGI
jgi:hypothetical protein